MKSALWFERVDDPVFPREAGKADRMCTHVRADFRHDRAGADQ